MIPKRAHQVFYQHYSYKGQSLQGRVPLNTHTHLQCQNVNNKLQKWKQAISTVIRNKANAEIISWQGEEGFSIPAMQIFPFPVSMLHNRDRRVIVTYDSQLQLQMPVLWYIITHQLACRKYCWKGRIINRTKETKEKNTDQRQLGCFCQAN